MTRGMLCAVIALLYVYANARRAKPKIYASMHLHGKKRVPAVG